MEQSNIDELIEKAREEIRKISLVSEEKTNTDKQEMVKNVLEQSVAFADNVLKRLVAHTVGVDVLELFDECLDSRGEILIEETDGGSYTLSMDIVHRDYMLDLLHFNGNGAVSEKLIFLLNTVKALYCPIKDHMKVWAAKNNTTFNYVLQIGLNTTLFLDSDSEKRIGILLTKV